MRIPRVFNAFLSTEERALLRAGGNRLQKLANGKTKPNGLDEKRFVASLQKGPPSRTSRLGNAYQKYVALQKLVDEREFARLRGLKLTEELRRAREINRELKERLEKEGAFNETLVTALENSVSERKPYRWDKKALVKLPKVVQEKLREHQWLFLLRNDGRITRVAFEQICRHKGVWSAFRMYEENRDSCANAEKKGLPIYPRRAALGLPAYDRCGACGRPIIDYRCGCSE